MSAEQAAYFYGSYQNRLSPKGQVAIPKRFRDVLSAEEAQRGFVLIPGQSDCIYMYTHGQFGKIRENVRQVALRENDPEFFRLFLEESRPVDLDTQGRFVIPTELRTYAKIGGQDVLFIGVDDRIELWSPQVREAGRCAEAEYGRKRQQSAREIFGI